MRKWLLVPGVLGLLINAAPTLAQATRPAMAQLNAEAQSLYADVAAGTVYVQLPVATLARLTGPTDHFMRKWSEIVDDRIWDRMEDLAATRPVGTSGDGDRERVDQGPTREAAAGESKTIAYLDDGTGKMVAVLPDDSGGHAEMIGVVLDDVGHIAIPTYVTQDDVAGHPLHVTAGMERVEATFVGSDRQTNVTVVKLVKPFGRPMGVADGKPPLGSLVMMLSPSRRAAALKVWSGGYADHAVVIDLSGRLVGFARPGQLLGGGNLRFVAAEIVKHGKVKRAQLGALIGQVQPNDPIRQQVASLGARPALRVAKVLSGSAAEAGGVQAGDLILSLAGTPVDDIPTFAAAISSHSGPTELKLLREGRETVVTVNLEPR